ncbi:MAG: hypothetical protein LC126_30955 [Bryobacterales bacterium]|nr:hypothetical protein [Bryobacterales bacterium]
MKTGSLEEVIASAGHAIECARAKFFLGELPGSTLSLHQAARHLQDASAMFHTRMPQEERLHLLAAMERFQVAVRHFEAMNSQAAAFDSVWARRLAEALEVESGFAYGPGRQDGLALAASRIQFEA